MLQDSVPAVSSGGNLVLCRANLLWHLKSGSDFLSSLGQISFGSLSLPLVEKLFHSFHLRVGLSRNLNLSL